MQIQLKSNKIWLASEPVDFRKAIDGLGALVCQHFKHKLDDSIYIFYNRSKNKLKILSYHRNGMMLIYKRLDNRRFTFKQDSTGLYAVDAKQLSWLLAGLDWVEMSVHKELTYDDYS